MQLGQELGASKEKIQGNIHISSLIQDHRRIQTDMNTHIQCFASNKNNLIKK